MALGSGQYGQSESPFTGVQPFIIQITGNESGGGKYRCDAWEAGKALLQPTGNVSVSNVTAGTRHFVDAVFVNLQETSTHDLTNADNTDQKLFVGLMIGYTSESTPRAVFVGNALWTTACP